MASRTARFHSLPLSRSSQATFLLLGLAGLLAAGACSRGVRLALELINETRHVIADASAQLDRAAEASNRAVLVSKGEDAQAAGKEAEVAHQKIQRDLEQADALLHELSYVEELKLLQQARDSISAYETMETSILALAREKTNRKALELAFGPVAEAADAFRQALTQISAAASGPKATAIQLECANAALGVREVQLLQPPHIEERSDEVMTGLEQRMGQALGETQKAMSALATLRTPEARATLEAANAALARFTAAHGELLQLSRRNSDVKALALSLERKQPLLARCHEALAALSAALVQRTRPGTR